MASLVDDHPTGLSRVGGGAGLGNRRRDSNVQDPRMLNREFRTMVLLAIGLALTLGACADPEPGGTTTTAPEPGTTTTTTEPGPTTGPELRATCGAVELAGGLDPVLPATPIDAEGEAALAVIDELAPVESALLDQYEWFTAESIDDRLILFGVPIGEMPADSLPYASATFQPDGDTWLPEGWGQCRIEVSSPGFGNAYWVLDPEIDPATSGTELHVLINERECASGEPPVGREILPVVLEEPDSITITVLVEPVSGGANCPSNPWHPITIDLSESVGDRTLFDASVAPRIERTWPPSQELLDSFGSQP